MDKFNLLFGSEGNTRKKKSVSIVTALSVG
jgi:hypothetical protein